MSFLLELDRFLHAEAPYHAGSRRLPFRRIITFVVVGGAAYGLVMGLRGGSLLQGLFSASKVPILILLSTLICLPSSWVAHRVLRLGDDFPDAFRGILASQAGFAIGLASLTPLVAFAYVCGIGYDESLLLHGFLFGAATLAAQRVLSKHYRVLARRSRRHRITRHVWAGLYVFVAVELAWILRPFVGNPDLEPRFLRPDAWSNAYIEIVELVLRVLRG